MCGIVGTLYKNEPSSLNEQKTRESLLNKMVSKVAHRGPDAQSIHKDFNCYLGFTRLAFVGGKKAVQPLHNEDRTIWLVCNGEIYNYKTLERLLVKKNHKFYSGSDCEVIIHLYEELGDEFVDKLDGQFAFVLWDSRRRRIFGARDRFGICPLFYSITNSSFTFGSEIKAILASENSSPSLDIGGLIETALLYSPTPPKTAFKNIFRLPASTSFSFDLNSWRFETKNYWEIPFLKKNSIRERRNFTTLKDVLYQNLEETVKIYTNHGNKPVSIMISGGIDSSILAYMAKDLGKIKNSFGLSFEDKNLDESYYQNKLAKYLGIKHHNIRCKDEEIFKLLPEVLWHVEAPLFRTAPIPLFKLSKAIDTYGYNSVLSGEGADELFCGYPIFFENQIRTILTEDKSPSEIKDKLGHFLKKEISNQELSDFKLKYNNHLPEFSDFPSHMSRWIKTKTLLDVFNADYIEKNTTSGAVNNLSKYMNNTSSNLTPLAWAQYTEMLTKQEGYVLSSQGDKVSMAHSVEKRLPYLSRKVATLALSIDETLRQNGEKDKFILREMMKEKLPEEFTYRPKQGYLAPGLSPFNRKYTKGSYIDELLSDSFIKETKYFNPKKVKILIEKINDSSRDNKDLESSYIFVLSTQLLHSLYITGTSLSSFA